MNEPDDQAFIDYEAEAAARAALTANNTPEDDRLLAMRVLRDIVANPRSKPEARKAAADSLLKEAERMGTATNAEVQAYSFTDDQLLAVIVEAQATRGQVSVSPAVRPEVAIVAAATGTPGASFLSALDGVAELDPLCQ